MRPINARLPIFFLKDTSRLSKYGGAKMELNKRTNELVQILLQLTRVEMSSFCGNLLSILNVERALP